jgi:hypothetical protein
LVIAHSARLALGQSPPGSPQASAVFHVWATFMKHEAGYGPPEGACCWRLMPPVAGLSSFEEQPCRCCGDPTRKLERALFEYLGGPEGLVGGPCMDLRQPSRRARKGAALPLEIAPSTCTSCVPSGGCTDAADNQPQHTLRHDRERLKTECLGLPGRCLAARGAFAWPPDLVDGSALDSSGAVEPENPVEAGSRMGPEFGMGKPSAWMTSHRGRNGPWT